MMQDPSSSSEGFDWQEWLEGLDLEQPLWELIDDPSWLEGVTFEPDDLAHVEERGREYAQELTEREMLPETHQMDMPESLLAPDHTAEPHHDLDFDH